MNNKIAYKKITERVLKELDKGIIAWKQPWLQMSHRNYFSKREYNGINTIMCLLAKKPTCEWATFNQITKKGYKVNKGAKGIPIIFTDHFAVKEENKNGEVKTKFIPWLKYYIIFNISQTNIPIPEYGKTKELPDCEKVVEELLNKLGIITLKGDRCCYNLKTDQITIPPREMFQSSEEYYTALFHEIIHATGTRLSRDMSTNFGDDLYSKEELVAEIGATFLAGYCGIDNTIIKNSVAYLQGWRNAIAKDNRLIVSASSKTQKAVNWLLEKMEVKNESNQTSKVSR